MLIAYQKDFHLIVVEIVGQKGGLKVLEQVVLEELLQPLEGDHERRVVDRVLLLVELKERRLLGVQLNLLRVEQVEEAAPGQERLEIEAVLEQELDKLRLVLYERHLHELRELRRTELLLAREYVRLGYVVAVPLQRQLEILVVVVLARFFSSTNNQ